MFPISKILTQTHINLTFHFIEKVITTTKLLLILIYIPYVMQNKYKTMHSLQFFARQIFKYWYDITPQCQRSKTTFPVWEIPQETAPVFYTWDKSFLCHTPIVWCTERKHNKSCNHRAEHNYGLQINNCTTELRLQHTPAWKTCPHSKLLTSSQLSPSWQMMQISSSSLGGCLDENNIHKISQRKSCFFRDWLKTHNTQFINKTINFYHISFKTQRN